MAKKLFWKALFKWKTMFTWYLNEPLITVLVLSKLICIFLLKNYKKVGNHSHLRITLDPWRRRWCSASRRILFPGSFHLLFIYARAKTVNFEFFAILLKIQTFEMVSQVATPGSGASKISLELKKICKKFERNSRAISGMKKIS